VIKEEDVATAVETKQAADGPTWYALSADEAAKELGVEKAHGLSAIEATARLELYGPNKFAEAKPEPGWRAFVRQYRDAMQLVLLVVGVGSIWPLHEYGTGIVVLALTVFNAILGLHQEGKAAAAVAALQKMMFIKARVRRDDQIVELPAEELVPGDVVAIEAGDIVPADGRLLEAATLEVAESALTGESLPVSKSIETLESGDTPLGDRTDMVYMNTNVTRGSGQFVVTGTGMSTEVGHISNMLQYADDTVTPLTKQLQKLTMQILFISGGAVVVSIIINSSRGHTFKSVFTAALAFAIAAIPTGLPAVVTTILSMGTQLLAKANAIVKRLRSTETLGATSVINSDKTGTLTLNQMTAVEMALASRRYTIDGTGYSTEGRILRSVGDSDVPLDQFLVPMVLASDAVVHDGEMIGDPTEGALVVLAAKGGLDVDATRADFPRVAELPFDTEYKLMATFHRMKDETGKDVVRCFVKGAPDQLLARSTTFLDTDLKPASVDDEAKQRYLAENQRLGEQGLRVLATARRDFSPDSFDQKADLLGYMQELTVLTLVGIVDPARPTAKDAIASAKTAGIRVRMITGDHAVTAAAIATQLGIEGRAITGAEFAAMSDEEAVAQIDEIGVLARVTPEDKVRLVETLRTKGAIVAMTGDGVNDAPALKKADIGIAMGITGTEVSKEAGDMILTDDNFATIVKAVEIGRGLYDNLTKYIRFQMGVLAGMVLSFLGAAIFNVAGGVIFVPLQTLWLNFTTQVFQAVGLGYGKFADNLMKRNPRAPNEPILDKLKFIWIAIAGLVMAVGTVGIAWWADDNHGAAVARTMALTTFSIANLLFSFTALDERRTVFSMESFSDRKFLFATGLSIVAIVLGTEMDVLNKFLQTTGLTRAQWGVCLIVPFSVIIASELWKLYLRHREKPQAPATATEPPPETPAAEPA
jgi:P-type Ca2+ transporter type 2C